AAPLRRAPIDDARFVEMDVRLDKAGTGEAALGVVLLPFRCERMLDRGNAASFHADIDDLIGRPIGETRIADNEVQGCLLGFDVGGLYQRPPFVDFGSLMRGVRRRGAAPAAESPGRD